jgi:hypothetical protein
MLHFGYAYAIKPVLKPGKHGNSCLTKNFYGTDDLKSKIGCRRGYLGLRGMMQQGNTLYSSPNIIRVIIPRRPRWAGNVAHKGERRCAYRVLVGKPGGRRPLGRPTDRRDVIKRDLKEVLWGHGLD